MEPLYVKYCEKYLDLVEQIREMGLSKTLSPFFPYFPALWSWSVIKSNSSFLFASDSNTLFGIR